MRERRAKDQDKEQARDITVEPCRWWQLIHVLFQERRKVLRRVVLSDSMLLKDHPVHCTGKRQQRGKMKMGRPDRSPLRARKMDT